MNSLIGQENCKVVSACAMLLRDLEVAAGMVKRFQGCGPKTPTWALTLPKIQLIRSVWQGRDKRENRYRPTAVGC